MDSTGISQRLRHVLLIFIVLFACRVILGTASLSLTGESYRYFFLASDMFADSIKSGLAQSSVSAPLFTDPHTQTWPELFQNYLNKNEYLTHSLSIHHSPPLATLLLMGFAAMLLSITPFGVVGLLMAIYAAAATGVAKAIERARPFGGAATAAGLIILAYPSLFMLNRGNFHSGLTSLAIIFYVFSAVFRRWKWASWLALALAVNLRPNVAIFALLELYRTHDRAEAVKAMFAAGALSVAVGLVSLLIAGGIDPAYSLPAFFKGFALYQSVYVEGVEGLQWNASLPNVVKLVRYQWHISEIYSPLAAAAVNLLGLVAILTFAALGWLRRMPAISFVFALAALCGLFTPVLAEYHLLIFMAPLLLAIVQNAAEITPERLRRGAVLIFEIQILCLVYWVMAHWQPLQIVLLFPLAAMGLALPAIIWRMCGAGTAAEPVAALALVSMAVLSPLGNELSNGMMVAMILLATLAMLLWRAIMSAPDRQETTAGENSLTILP